jgi:flagellin
MNEISNVLVRLRELSIQGASDTIGDLERSYIDREVQGLKQEVTRISNSIEFNGTKLLNGSAPTMEIQVGTHNNPEQDRFVFDTKRNIATLDALGLGDVSTVSKMNSQDNLDKIDSALNAMSSSRAELGALQNRLTSTINNMGIYRENLEAANSRIRDADIAEETSELTKYNILTQANISVLSQANQNASLALKLLS